MYVGEQPKGCCIKRKFLRLFSLLVLFMAEKEGRAYYQQLTVASKASRTTSLVYRADLPIIRSPRTTDMLYRATY